MNTIEAVKKLIDASGKSRRAVSLEMGKNINFMNSVINRGESKGAGMNGSTLALVAKATGYHLVFTRRLTDNMFEITPDDEDE